MTPVEIIILVLLIVACGVGVYFFIKNNKDDKPEPVDPVVIDKALWKNARIITLEKEGGEIKDEPISVSGNTNVKVVLEEGDASAITIDPKEGKNLKATSIKVAENTGDKSRTFKVSIEHQ